MTLWIYLHFPALQLDTLFAEQKTQATVIIDTKRFQVVQCNHQAEQQGIQIGMGLGCASALCHALQVHPYDTKQEQNSLKDIAQWLYLVTSDIALFPPHGLLLKATNMLSLYGGLEAYWTTIKNHLEALNIHYHYSCGYSPYAAMLLAKSAVTLLSQNKEEITNTLYPYPLSATELNEKQVDALARVGVQNIRDLLTLPMQDIARRFDIDLVNYVGRLTGQFKHPVTFYHPPEKFKNHLELLFDIENIQWLEKPLKTLLDKLEQFLTLRNQIAYELELTLHQRDHSDGKIYFTSACGDYKANHWWRLCQLSIESIQLEAPVQGLTLTIIRAGELESRGSDIFNGTQDQQSELELIGLLQAKLGQGKVHKVTLTDDPRPERATQLCAPEQTLTHIRPVSRLRPTFILPTPEPLQETVSIVQGPERFVTGWWDGDGIVRDYFIARSDTGRWLWIFRDQDKRWFLHGQFS